MNAKDSKNKGKARSYACYLRSYYFDLLRAQERGFFSREEEIASRELVEQLQRLVGRS